MGTHLPYHHPDGQSTSKQGLTNPSSDGTKRDPDNFSTPNSLASSDLWAITETKENECGSTGPVSDDSFFEAQEPEIR